MARYFEGKVAIVTASTDGIGFAIAERLCREGAKVVISSRKQENVDRATSELKSRGYDVIGLVCHVGNKDHRDDLVKQTLDTFGGIDFLVLNAATNPAAGELLGISESKYDKIMDVNLKSAFFLCTEVVPHMERRGSGSIVLISSNGAYSYNLPNLKASGIYSVSKAAMVGLTKVLANHLAEKNIRVNCVAPGLIKTAMSKIYWNNAEFIKALMAVTPLNRAGISEECAGPVLFLMSPDASYITGETLVVAGGLQSRL